MTSGMWIAVAAALSPLVGLSILTGVGSRRRGDPAGYAVLCALVFPLTWTAWYVVDDLHHGRRDVVRHCCQGRATLAHAAYRMGARNLVR